LQHNHLPSSPAAPLRKPTVAANKEVSICLHAVVPDAMFPIHLQCPSFSILSIENCQMPSLFRFLALIGVVGGLIYGAMFVLATWFDPQPHEITVSIPPDRFAKQP
jgi:hypothetical protein